eukprot:m51a1_g2355 hypothetical protein (782) ;mRNA; f:600957-603609
MWGADDTDAQDDRVLGGAGLMMGGGDWLGPTQAFSFNSAASAAAAGPATPSSSSSALGSYVGAPSMGFVTADAASYFGDHTSQFDEDLSMGSELASPIDDDARVGDSPGSALLRAPAPAGPLIIEAPVVPQDPLQPLQQQQQAAVDPNVVAAVAMMQGGGCVGAATAPAPMSVPIDAVVVPSPGSVCSPLAIKQEQAPKCIHCLRRLKDMLESYSVQCQAGARKWEQNWRESGLQCFGACQSSEFCTDHGYPLPICLAHNEETRHCVFSYRGTWVMQRAKREAPDMTAAVTPTGQQQQQQQQTQQHPLAQPDSAQKPRAKRHRPTLAELTSSTSSPSDGPGTGCVGGPRECVVRLEKLRSYEWVCNDPKAVQLIREAEALAQTQCQGYCRTQYCCKIHWVPAHIHKEEGKATRYRCPYPHESKGKKGRHHLDYAFYCPDPACCNGKWYSRDETHNRRHAPRAPVSDVMDKMLAEGGLQSGHEDDDTADEDRVDESSDSDDADECELPLAAAAAPPQQKRVEQMQRALAQQASDEAADDYEAERQPLVSRAGELVNCAAGDIEACEQQPEPAVQQLRGPTHDSMGSIFSSPSSVFPSLRSTRLSARLRGRVVLPRAVFVGLVALCGVLVIAAAVPSAILARSLMGTGGDTLHTPVTRMCWSARWADDRVGSAVRLAENCEECSWVEASGRYLCAGSAAPDRKLSLLATIDPDRNVLTGYYVNAGNATHKDATERQLPCLITISESLGAQQVAERATGGPHVVPRTAVVAAAEDSWTLVLTRV